MSKKFLVPIDMTQLELLNVQLQQLGSDPGTPVVGQLWYRSDVNRPRWYDGTAGQYLYPFASGNTPTTGVLRDGSGNFTAGTITANLTGIASQATTLFDGVGYQGGSFYLARANHTGTQLASTISNFDTQVRTSRLDQMAAPTASVSFNNQTITNLGTPVNPTDAATKAYVDATAQGLNVKTACRLATVVALPANARVGNVLTALSNGTLSVDGTAAVVGDRILVKDEATTANNGIFEVTDTGSAGSPFILTRTADADTSAEVKSGMFTFIEDGVTNDNTGWVLTTNNPIVLNTTGLVFAQFSSTGSFTAGNGIDITANVISVDATARFVFSGGSLDLATVVGAGTYTMVTVDVYGRVTAGQDIVTTNGFVARTAAGTFAARTMTGTAARVTVTNGDGVAGNPTFDIAATYVGQTSITTLGTITTGDWQATPISVNFGGTGATSAAAGFNNLSPMTTLGDIIYGGASGAGTRLAGNVSAVRQFLNQTGTGAVSAPPTWGTLLAADIPNLDASKITTGVFPIARGGTNSGTALANGKVMVSAAGAIVESLDVSDDGTTFSLSKRLAFLAVSPVSFSTQQDDYAPGDGVVYLLTASSAASLTGVIDGSNGREIILINAGSNAITLESQHAGSAAANRFLTLDGSDVVLAANDSATLVYDATASRWRVVSQTSQRAISAASITSGILPLARGGTGSDLSATGGAGFVLKQSSSGANITSAALLDADIPSVLSANARVGVQNAGTLVGTRRAINFIAGTGVSYTIADNGGSERVDVTINATGTVTKYAVSIGNGVVKTFTITHNLGTLDVIVAVYEVATGEHVNTDIIAATTNTVTITVSGPAPSTNQYRVVVLG